MVDLAGHLGAVDKATLFEALERSASQVGLAVFVIHVDATPPIVVYASELLSELVGRPREDLVGRPPWELVAPEQRDRVREIIAARGPGAPPISLLFEILRPDKTKRSIEVGVARITTTSAELAVCYFRDTTPLARSEALARSLIENAPDGVVILQQGRIVQANPVAMRMFGIPTFESVRGHMITEFLLPAEGARAMERIKQLYSGVEVKSSEYELINGRIGEVHSVLYEHEGQPAILSFVRDVTERRQMQQQLVRADRLAALGTMAATVAHEINNPLTYLQLNLQRLEREAVREPDPERARIFRENIANALHGVERVARIVRDLRAHSRDPIAEPDGPIDVVEAVDRAVRMVEHDLRHRAELVRRDPDQPAIISGSAGRLEQVIINLLVNAVQALDSNHPTCNQITLDIAVAETVTITIGDTGHGLADPDRVFEPFYTTKPISEGTGLGLFVCRQLVEGMGGRIEVARTGPTGTVIAVTLPRRTEVSPEPVAAVVPPRGARLRLLVIDDEVHVRTVLGTLLASDHDVDLAGDGETALGKLAASDYDVILCDLMMPNMNGRDVYERLRATRPGHERRIVFVTGGAFVPSLSEFLDSVDNLKLAKPFRLEHALEVVREAARRDSV